MIPRLTRKLSFCFTALVGSMPAPRSSSKMVPAAYQFAPLLCLGLLLTCIGSAQAAPVVTTLAATGGGTSTSVTLNGSINADGETVLASFEYARPLCSAPV